MDRRSLLGLVGGLGVVAGMGDAAASTFTSVVTQSPSQSPPPTPSSSPSGPAFAERSLGKPDAPLTVIEYFSMTCPHCAEFATHALPKVIKAYVDTGKLHYVFRDFPLDSVALTAAQVARSLPEAQYWPFISALFASQDQWAFNPDLKTPKQFHDALFRYAALAGMDRTAFDAAIANTALRSFILQEEKTAEAKYHIDATPSFLFGGKKYEGAKTFEEFSTMIHQA